ncbi:MAG: hypothetical protein ACPGUY_01625, partial [Akkermansiaceae bacterium]
VMSSTQLATAQDSVRFDFSVYYPGNTSTGTASGSSGSAIGKERKALTMVSDLHYGVGEKNISLHIKQARQTILYPYRGSRKFSLFRVKTIDGEEVREVVASTTIPQGVRKGVFILLDNPEKAGGFLLRPFWMEQQKVKKGTARILNLSGRDVALLFDKGKSGKGVIKKKGAYSVPGKFSGGSNLSYVTMEAFVTRRADKPNGFKVLHRDLMISRKDTSVYLIVNKQKHFLDLITLSLAGANNPREQARLEKFITPGELDNP